MRLKCLPSMPEDIMRLYGDADGVEAEMQHVNGLLATTPEAEGLMSTSARSLFDGDDLVAILGVWPMWPGAGRCWTMLPPETLRRFPKSIHQQASELLAFIVKRDSLIRVEAIVIEGHEAGRRWIERLGFEHEALMRNYGIQGQNCHLYSRCKNG